MIYESTKVGYALVEIVAIRIIAFYNMYKYPEVSVLSIILLYLK